MTDLALITDHTEQALDLLISQYKNLPRLSGLIGSFTNRVQELEDATWDAINKRLLDYTDRDGSPAHAMAAQLDAIGRLVGQPRNGQDDATYLLYVRARILLNKSRARREQVIRLLQLIEPAAFTYSEFYPATVVVEFVDEPTADPNALFDLARLAITGGVQLFLIAPTNGDDHTFTCGEIGTPDDPEIGYIGKGFGDSVSGAVSSFYGGELASVYT